MWRDRTTGFIVNNQVDSNLANIKANGVANVFSVRNDLEIVKG